MVIMHNEIRSARYFAAWPVRCWLLLSCLCLFLNACASTESQIQQPSLVGARNVFANHVDFSRLKGGSLSTSELKGKPTLLTFFTTWCLRCQAEAGRFEQIHERYQSKGLTVVGIALDLQGSKFVKPYVDAMGLTFEVLLSHPDSLDLTQVFGKITQVPRTLLLDREGRVVLDQMGQTNFYALQKKIDDMF